MTFLDNFSSKTFTTLTPADSQYSEIFKAINPAVQELYICSNKFEDLMVGKRVAIVGTRNVTPYGKQVTQQFASELAGQGVIIVSGLAYGVDAIAHRAALDAGGLTIAVLPSSLSRIYPSVHANLARRIVEQGGAIISEYPVGSDIAYKNQFVDRNRIVSGISHALLITEAAEDSGTMHTATYAFNQNREVMAVPGNITSPLSAGTNNLLRRNAHAVTTPDDVLHILGIDRLGERPPVKGRCADEQAIIDLLERDVHSGEQLLEQSQLGVSKYSQALTMLEITGKIFALGANKWALR